MSNSLNWQGITRRNKREGKRNDNKEVPNEIVIEKRTSWMKTLKYYYDRFRYYQFYIADKVETTIAVICLWIIKLYFSLMGYGPILNDTELTIDDE